MFPRNQTCSTAIPDLTHEHLKDLGIALPRYSLSEWVEMYRKDFDCERADRAPSSTGFTVFEPSMGGKWLMAPQAATGPR